MAYSEFTEKDYQLIERDWAVLRASAQRRCASERELGIVEKAFKFANEAHKNVRRRSGEPYMLHPIAVAQIVVDNIGLGYKSISAALLHDVVEDTELTPDDLRAEGFPEEVVRAVARMTHPDGVPYLEYVETLKEDPLARKVKLADLRHNSDLSRLDRVTEKDLQRVEKYRKAMEILESAAAACAGPGQD